MDEDYSTLLTRCLPRNNMSAWDIIGYMILCVVMSTYPFAVWYCFNNKVRSEMKFRTTLFYTVYVWHFRKRPFTILSESSTGN